MRFSDSQEARDVSLCVAHRDVYRMALEAILAGDYNDLGIAREIAKHALDKDYTSEADQMLLRAIDF